MENVEGARILDEYADLLDIREANPFRVRSYHKAAQTIAGLSRPVAQLIAAGEDLTELPGIGSSMAAHLKEIVETGSLAALGQMRREFPETLSELMRLETLGPKKARKLYDALGITSVSELAAAIEAGKVQALPGFGKKTAENLRRAISQSAQHRRRFLLVDTDQLIQPLLKHLRAGPGMAALDVAGSYRRRQETVGDIDILAGCDNAPPLMHHFLAYPDVAHVEMAGTTRGTMVLRSGLQVDLRIVPCRSYGAALHYFTGSKAHNVAVRKLGVERGLRINEYGVFRVPKEKGEDALRRRSRAKKSEDVDPEAGERVGGETEEEVFHAAKEYDVVLEIDAQPQRLDLNDMHVHRARALGVPIAIDSDAHNVEQLRFMRYGIDQARRGWLEKRHVVNTMSWAQLRQWLQRKRS